MDDRIGSVEIGKEATIFVSEGSPLDMRTNSLTFTMIREANNKPDSHKKKLSSSIMDSLGLLRQIRLLN